MASLKPNKPSIYDGKREDLAVRTWLYQVDQYLTLAQVGNQVPLSDETKIAFATSYMTSTAATWWYTLVASNSAPTVWEEFKNAVTREFVPFDSIQRSRDKLRRLTQRFSVAAYLAEFRNIILTIPHMTEDEKVDRFCQGLKPQIRLEVMKAGARTMNDASRIALNVDAALYGAGAFSYTPYRNPSGPVPMDIGNVEQHARVFRGACHLCQKEGCRPFICRPRHVKNTRYQNFKPRQVDDNSGKD